MENFLNRIRFDRIMVMSLWPRFFGPSYIWHSENRTFCAIPETACDVFRGTVCVSEKSSANFFFRKFLKSFFALLFNDSFSTTKNHRSVIYNQHIVTVVVVFRTCAFQNSGAEGRQLTTKRGVSSLKFSDRFVHEIPIWI